MCLPHACAIGFCQSTPPISPRRTRSSVLPCCPQTHLLARRPRGTMALCTIGLVGAEPPSSTSVALPIYWKTSVKPFPMAGFRVKTEGGCIGFNARTSVSKVQLAAAVVRGDAGQATQLLVARNFLSRGGNDKTVCEFTSGAVTGGLNDGARSRNGCHPRFAPDPRRFACPLRSTRVPTSHGGSGAKRGMTVGCSRIALSDLAHRSVHFTSPIIPITSTRRSTSGRRHCLWIRRAFGGGYLSIVASQLVDRPAR